MIQQLIGKQIRDLLAKIPVRVPADISAISVTGITADSRQVLSGMLFVAIRGESSDGHQYIQEAVRKGCVAVVAESSADKELDVPLIEVSDTRAAMGHIAAAFYDYPASEMVMVGITGTNGKTTSSYILEQLIAAGGGVPAVIGTINIRYLDVSMDSTLTTPEPLDIQKQLRIMADRGVTHVVMEVSSHGIAQGRVNAMQFDVALFTNLSRDHLDFHGSMDNYFAAKQRLFVDHMKKTGKAVVVVGKPSRQHEVSWGRKLADFLSVETDLQVITCGIEDGDVKAEKYTFSLAGICAEITANDSVFEIEIPLVGAFNLENVLGCIACGLVLGYTTDAMTAALKVLKGVPGRLERITVGTEENGEGVIHVFVDYAHTPEALSHVLQAIKDLQPLRLVVVFGCGGDRDKGKRPLMGEAAGKLADVCLLTSDNPRSELPSQILTEIEKGLQGISVTKIDSEELRENPQLKGYDIIESRRKAIQRAIETSRPGDVILICGKGHESYQIDRSGRIFFDDRQEAREQLERNRQAA
ncbi:MAG: UDP-N-acetylmuramoyl-L-alanyl-D-glutamate--2,6-diaminopimelate ligase [Desulfobulbaceae bacterium]|uniref:UDP-N-acetylmuramoyl-L-alanyl-D-glutamate--2,6-diaminopimelate ligase n=1 Tax=Candidatus Desulfobia pelagia TaxID=2841692 RepID=A0A8J6NGG1_9BACT|nr:UDP-N-acetylmuramoyl-L-alanyl-D-glutamate--2,6-diaminopimelate ligase [Candidatus Desulfobia pelagia]